MSTQGAPAAEAHAIAGARPHLLLVRAPYYAEIVEGMTEGARRILQDAGATAQHIDVAGAFELPQAIRIALGGHARFDGFIALGCVVRGETDHYDFICAATLQGLMAVALEHGIALGSGVLTVDDLVQARARSAADRHNKGAEAAAAALRQIGVARTWGRQP